MGCELGVTTCSNTRTVWCVWPRRRSGGVNGRRGVSVTPDNLDATAAYTGRSRCCCMRSCHPMPHPAHGPSARSAAKSAFIGLLASAGRPPTSCRALGIPYIGRLCHVCTLLVPRACKSGTCNGASKRHVPRERLVARDELTHVCLAYPLNCPRLGPGFAVHAQRAEPHDAALPGTGRHHP